MSNREIYFPLDRVEQMATFLAQLTREGIAFRTQYVGGDGWYIYITGF